MESDITIVLKTAYLPNRLSLPKPLGLLNTLSDFKDLFCPYFSDEQKESQRVERTSSKRQQINYG